MGILIGPGMPQGPVFDRAFFNTTLGSLVDRASGRETPRLTLYLSDGTTLDVCQIEEMTDQYVAVRATRSSDGSCSLVTSVIPYFLIYRIDISPKGETDERLGFHWKRPRETGERGS